MIMLEYLFKSIPKILFEPLAITALLWIVPALFFFRKRDKVLYWVIFTSIVFMLAWRLAFPAIMLSSRYASFLIYPSVIFTACLCFKAPPVFRWLFRKLGWNFPEKRTVCKLLSVGIFIGLTAACIGKTLHTNPYGNFIGDTVKTYQKEVKVPAYIYTQEIARIAWYTGRDIKDIGRLNTAPQEQILPAVRKRIRTLKNIPGNHCFFFYLTKEETAPSPDSLKDVLAGGTWTILDRRYVSKKKNREFLLAVYTPVCPNIEEWNGEIPQEAKGNRIFNGNFERVLQGKALEDFLARCRKNGVQKYLHSGELELPEKWWVNIGCDNRENPPDIRLQSNRPLVGKYSLFLDSRPPRKTAITDTWFSFDKEQGRFSLWIQAHGTNSSKVRLVIKTKDRNLKNDQLLEALTFLLSGGKTYHVKGDISLDKAPRYLCLQILVDGCVTIDQASVVPR